MTDPDALYQPLGDLGPWAAAAVDDVVGRGALLAAAHESGALDGLYAGDRGLALSLLRGVASLGAVGERARAHVQANYEALRMARDATDGDLASEAWIRRVHEVACRPQSTYPVVGDAGTEDHVLAHGTYKHHPNHALTASGSWLAHAPVARLRDEMRRFLEAVVSPAFAALHPFARAAYVHHAMTHIAPFEDGNGRVARVLASAHLLRAARVPLLIFADESPTYVQDISDPAALVAFVGRRCRAVLSLLAEAPTADHAAALDRWRERAEAGGVLAEVLPGAVDAALTRHRRRSDLGWLAPLTDAVVVGGSPVVIRDAATGVEESMPVDAHPVADDGVLVLRAEQAQLRLDVHPGDLVPVVSGPFAARLDAWLDRAVSCLALRVAAELE